MRLIMTFAAALLFALPILPAAVLAGENDATPPVTERPAFEEGYGFTFTNPTIG